jgi:endonuclease YncB( thermonuclease family)
VQRPVVEVRPGDQAAVVHVVDGDTLYLKMQKKGAGAKVVKVRLAGVAAPECEKDRVRLPGGRPSSRCVKDREFYGLESYRALNQLVGGQAVTVGCEISADGLCKRGSYGRYIVDLAVDGRDVGETLIGRGAALTFTKYFHPALGRLCAAEDRARQGRQGMWNTGARGEVISKMSRKTQRWYRHRDQRCQMAAKGVGALRP